ncbi:hypothetical protein EX30DRAFT_399143 [Ascodesmis nigricans]|uniref:WD40 repeat-like protein n=1 Tax=Ascodesmis nigricans TaxID=341454 RepID=A0A4S2MQL8_9PEZI|nr:hypothetical protein EX30DRAFT_399143 [Ascodesmis nigricans]
MATQPLTPRISHPTPQSTLFSYPIRHTRTTALTTYPRPTPTSPEILIYGHSTGITFLYTSPDSPSHDSTPYTLHLGTPVLSLSTAPEHLLLTPPSHTPLTPARTLLTSSLILTAACADRTIRLISLPLTPSSNPQPQILTLGGGVSSHQLPATSISLSLLPRSISPRITNNPSFNDSDSEGNDVAIDDDDDEDLVIASASPDSTGLLLIWRIPIPRYHSTFRPTLPKLAPRPEQWHLASPATALRFNTSPLSLTRRHQLLVAESAGVVRILDLARQHWVVSLHLPVAAAGGTGRVTVLAAEWCCGGRGIVVVGEDGRWGVWDTEGVLSGRLRNLVEFVVEGVVAPPPHPVGRQLAGSSSVAAGAMSHGMAAASIAVLQMPGTHLIPASSASLHIEDEAIAILALGRLMYVPSLRRLFREKALSSSSSSSAVEREMQLVKKGESKVREETVVSVEVGAEADVGVGLAEAGRAVVGGVGWVGVLDVGGREEVEGEEQRAK